MKDFKQHSITHGDTSGIDLSEISIVDVFTMLIFDIDSELTETQQMVVTLLGQYEPAVANANRIQLSDYLRTLDVSEMIDVVMAVKHLLKQQQQMLSIGNEVPPAHLRH